MIAMNQRCLDENEIRQVLLGEFSGHQFETAVSHLNSCETCRVNADTLESKVIRDALGNRSPKHDSSDALLEIDPLQNETACHVALQSILQQSPGFVAPQSKIEPPLQTLGPYRMLRWIGSGGMGAVYLAEHQRLRRKCAIKLLSPERVAQCGWLDRFEREMTAVATLQHPNVVQATDAGHESGWHYLVMEYLDGMDLGRIAHRMGQLDVADACEIVRQAAAGLAHVHECGLVHRDIKPSNVMLTRSGDIKLLDLGLVLEGDDPLSRDDRLTTVGHVMGTMPYMAPEQLADSRDVGPRSDLYSLGATLYRLIAGRAPHPAGRGLASQVLAITSQDARPLDEIRDDIDRGVVLLVGELLSRDAKQRPATATEVAERLAPYCESARLKRLVRDASRRVSDDDSSPTGGTRSIAIEPSASGGPRLGRWLLGLVAGALMLAAAIVLKIQTDRGELVVHSEQAGLVVSIKQGDQVVEQLQIEQGKGNRTLLRKGSYTVAIEGAGDALKLSEDVVTIGRGEEVTLSVTERKTKSDQGSASAGSKMVLFDTKQKAEQIRQRVFQSVGHDGRMLEELLETITNSQYVEKVCDAVYAAARAIEYTAPARAVSLQEPERRFVIRTIIGRSREFGGIRKKLPPLPGDSVSDVSPSERFMWCLSEVFGKADPSLWVDIASDEIIRGNTSSRAAMIYCLSGQGPMYIGGLMGGGYMGGGGGGMGGGGSGLIVSSDLIRAQILRGTAALSSPDAWHELRKDNRIEIAAMARALAIDTSNGVSAASRLKPLVDAIREVPEERRTDQERKVLAEAEWEVNQDRAEQGSKSESNNAASEGN